MGIWDVYPQQLVECVSDMKFIETGLPKIPEGMVFEELKDINEIYVFLRDNYTNTGKSKVYSKKFLEWYLYGALVVGVRKGGKLCGMISGKVCNVNICDKKLKLLEVNFLCVCNSERNMRFAQYLIDYLWMCNNECGALFNTERELPLSFSSTKFFAYPINIEKLEELSYFGGVKRDWKSIFSLGYTKPLRRVTDISLVYSRLLEFYKSKVYIEVDKRSFELLSGVCEMYCTEDNKNFASVYYTLEGGVVVGNVYLYYFSENCDLIARLLQTIRCDLLVFPETIETGVKKLTYTTLRYHMFKHTTVSIPCNYFVTI